MQLFILFFVKAIVRIFALLPMQTLYFISDILYYFFRFVLGYRKKIIKKNLNNSFPKKNEKEINQLANQFYHYFSDLIVETIKGFTFSKEELQKRFVYKNPEMFDGLFSQNKSAILLGSHYGNWEWGSLSFPLAVKHKVVGIYKPIKNRQVEHYINGMRKQWGLHLANMKNTSRAIFENKNEAVIYVFIADQTPTDVRNAHWVNFLHQDTPFLHGAAKLAHRTGFPVFHYKIKRLKRGFYEVIFEEICLSPCEVEPMEITVIYANLLEEMINEDPPFWLWSHRRWKRKRLMDE